VEGLEDRTVLSLLPPIPSVSLVSSVASHLPTPPAVTQVVTNLGLSTVANAIPATGQGVGSALTTGLLGQVTGVVGNLSSTTASILGALTGPISVTLETPLGNIGINIGQLPGTSGGQGTGTGGKSTNGQGSLPVLVIDLDIGSGRQGARSEPVVAVAVVPALLPADGVTAFRPEQAVSPPPVTGAFNFLFGVPGLTPQTTFLLSQRQSGQDEPTDLGIEAALAAVQGTRSLSGGGDAAPLNPAAPPKQAVPPSGGGAMPEDELPAAVIEADAEGEGPLADVGPAGAVSVQRAVDALLGQLAEVGTQVERAVARSHWLAYLLGAAAPLLAAEVVRRRRRSLARVRVGDEDLLLGLGET
jgi:hypothetical protein